MKRTLLLAISISLLGCPDDGDLGDTGASGADGGDGDEGKGDAGEGEDGGAEVGGLDGGGGEGSTSGGGSTGGLGETGETGEGSETGGGETGTGTGGLDLEDPCDPIVQDCEDGDTCVPYDGEFRCAPLAGKGGQGDACEFLNVCLPGFACTDAEFVPECDSAGCCSQFCDVDDVAPCPDGTECSAWFEDGEAPAGLEHVGICVIPE